MQHALGLPALWILCSVASLARLPAGLWDTLYGEDGFVFLNYWINSPQHGPAAWPILFYPYAGYQHGIPRLLSLLISFLPPATWGVAFAISASIAIGGIAVLSYLAAQETLRTPLARALVPAILIALPIGGLEAIANSANIHWYLSYLLFWMLWMKAPATRQQTIGWSLVAVCIAITEVQSAFLLPLLAWRFFRSRRSRVWIAAWGAGFTLQVVSFLTTGRSRAAGVPSATSLAEGYLTNAVLGSISGKRDDYRFLAGADLSNPWPLCGIALVILTAWVALALRTMRHTRAYAGPMLTALAMSIVFWTMAAGYNNNADIPPMALFRWGTAASLMVWATVPFVVDTLRRKAQLVALGVIVAIWAWNYLGTVPDRLGSTPWSQSVSQGRQGCAESGATSVAVPQTPPNWPVIVPCDRLLPPR